MARTGTGSRQRAARALEQFTPATRAWFASAFGAPTPVQEAAWDVIRGGECALVIAPTGSGKTLAAFLHAIDRLFAEKDDAAADAAAAATGAATRVLYISPIKALGADVQRNLRLPLDGVGAQRSRRGDPAVEITVGMRTGDTPGAQRAALLRRPPDILITTPESLYLMLTSKARETLRGVRTVIVDEVHAVAGTKRGSHMALSLERLDALLDRPAQRVGLSATVRPVDRVAAFLGGARPTTVVNPPAGRRLELRIVVPVQDMADIPARDESGTAGSIWPHVEASILEQVLSRRSTIVFANSRGAAEKLTARLNALYAERMQIPRQGDAPAAVQYPSSSGGTGNRTDGAAPLIARSHHGSVSKEQRSDIEDALKSGALRCVVATSSLELGIDMGLVDLVIQVAAPPSVASALQRVGRAGHQVGGTSRGLVYPRTRRELVDAAVTVRRMLAGELEAIEPPRNPLDVLAQQTVAAVAMDAMHVDDWYALVRRADPFRALPRSAFDATLDMLAGRYPSDEFAEFRPRLVWDRIGGQLGARPGAKSLAVISGGTIPDRGMFTVMLPEGEEKAGARRVGELDEEMVYESRVNDIITLGATSWRIQQITHDQVIVVPAPGRSARLPFWRGEGLGRPAELGEAIGAFLREVDAAPRDAHAALEAAGLDANAIANILQLAAQQREATGALPTDRTLVIERCRDEGGDWRVMLHSPYGQRVHAPWALAIAQRIRQRLNVDPSVVAGDDGIIARIPDMEGRTPGAELFLFDAEAVQRIVAEAVGASSLFAARFRECAARALLLPRRSPGKRSPLWQQRLRAGQLLEIARGYPDFPILIETARECLQDVYDLPALGTLMRRLQDGGIRMLEVTTEVPSPFAADLLFGYVAEFMYEGDAPLAERRASVLSLDSGLLADLLGQVDMGEILDPVVVEQAGLELQRIAAQRRASGMEGVADLLRELGPLAPDAIVQRTAQQDPAAVAAWLGGLEAAHRAMRVTVAGEERWAAVEDAARLRDALGARLPAGVPKTFREPVPDPLRDLVARYARTHGPFTTGEVATHFGLGAAVADEALERLQAQGKVLKGSFGVERHLRAQDAHRLAQGPAARHEWVAEDVLRRLRQRSLQAAREAAKPAAQHAYVQLVLERQALVPELTARAANDAPLFAQGALEGTAGVARVLEQLAGLALPASQWESLVLPARVRDYRPFMLDELLASGEAVWAGHGAAGDGDGLVSLHLSEMAADTLAPQPEAGGDAPTGLRQAILDVLGRGGAFLARQIAQHVDADPAQLHAALWQLAWSGYVTSDGWQPLRALTSPHGSRRAETVRPQRRSWRMRGRPQPPDAPEHAGHSGIALGDLTLAGRWSLVQRPASSDTERAFALAEGLLDRHGIVTRSAVMAENVPGGLPALRPVLHAMEDAGRVLPGRFVDGLGAGPFADKAAIERLRELTQLQTAQPLAVALSVLDPANPFGAALAWPAHRLGIRPQRRSGGIVVLCGGRLALYLTPGRRQLLTWLDAERADERTALAHALQALVHALEREKRGRFTIETVDEQPVGRYPLLGLLREAGFSRVPKGLSWYG